LKREGIFVIIVLVLITGYIFSAKWEKQQKDADEEEGVLHDSSVVRTSVVVYPIPEYLEFAGEKIMMDDPDLRERFDNEIIVNTHFHSSTIFMIKRSHRWFPQMQPILKKYNVPEDFLYISLIESGLKNDISPKGAVGFWQLLPETAREFGLEVSSQVDERYDPIKSTEAACQYILRAKMKLGSWTNAAAAYNMGVRGLSRQMDNQKVDSYYDLLLNEETSRYVFRVLATKQIMENQKKYGFYIPEDELYPVEEVKFVVVDETIPDLTEFALSQGINYKILKRHNPWLRRNSLNIRSQQKTYNIRIPVNREDYVMINHQFSDSLQINSGRMKAEEF
jgi:hypothetical protein